MAHPLRLLLVDLQTDQLAQRLVENPEIVQYVLFGRISARTNCQNDVLLTALMNAFLVFHIRPAATLLPRHSIFSRESLGKHLTKPLLRLCQFGRTSTSLLKY